MTDERATGQLSDIGVPPAWPPGRSLHAVQSQPHGLLRASAYTASDTLVVMPNWAKSARGGAMPVAKLMTCLSLFLVVGCGQSSDPPGRSRAARLARRANVQREGRTAHAPEVGLSRNAFRLDHYRSSVGME